MFIMMAYVYMGLNVSRVYEIYYYLDVCYVCVCVPI